MQVGEIRDVTGADGTSNTAGEVDETAPAPPDASGSKKRLKVLFVGDLTVGPFGDRIFEWSGIEGDPLASSKDVEVRVVPLPLDRLANENPHRRLLKILRIVRSSHACTSGCSLPHSLANSSCPGTHRDARHVSARSSS